MEWLNTRNIEQFNGTRYGTWKFRIKTLLEELRVSSVIEESPPENPNVEWTEKNSVAKCTIVNFLGDAFLHLAEVASKAKRKLQKSNLHSAQSSTNHSIKEEPVSIKQEPIEIKEEPVWIKQEPVWDQSEPVVVKTEPEDGQQRINVGVIPNRNEGPKRRRNRKNKRMSTEVIVMHIQAEKAAQVHENQQGPSVHN